MHTTEESSLIQLAAYNPPSHAGHHSKGWQLKNCHWPAQINTSSNLIFVSFQLRRFEDGSDNGHWPRCFSFREVGSSLRVAWAAVSGVNNDDMMNLRSKCLNSVVFCLLFYNSLASASSSFRPLLVTRGFVKKKILYSGSTASERKASNQNLSLE